MKAVGLLQLTYLIKCPSFKKNPEVGTATHMRHRREGCAQSHVSAFLSLSLKEKEANSAF